MAIVTFIMEDNEDGSVGMRFVSNTLLPENIEEFTPAQLFAKELKEELERLGAA